MSGFAIAGMPFALKEAGFGLGIILVILVAIVTGKWYLISIVTVQGNWPSTAWD